MPTTTITLRVIRRGDRADALLEHVAGSLGLSSAPEPDQQGIVRVRMPSRGPRAWDEVIDALENGGSDWRQWLHLEPRPLR